MATIVVDSSSVQLEKQKQRIDQLSTRRTRIQVQLETARQQYADAIKEAQETYGTSDLNTLREKLTQLIEQNSQAVQDHLAATDKFEELIVKIERALADPEALSELVASMTEQTPGNVEVLDFFGEPVVPVMPIAAEGAAAFDDEEI